MGVERQGSKTGGGYVGGFLHLFDWNAKSRKKLFPSKSDQPEKLNQKKRDDENYSTTQLHLMDQDDSQAGSSFKGSSDYSCASSVTDDDVGGSKAPGVVAKLMGLDSLPMSNFSEAYSTPFFDSRSLKDSYNYKKGEEFHVDHQIMHSGNMFNRVQEPLRNNIDPKLQKNISSPFKKFQSKVLPPKSAKSIPLTHRKLLSPIKSGGFHQSKNTVHIMEAAARIIESGNQVITTAKMPPVGRSVPLKVRDLKERAEAAKRPSNVETSRKPAETIASKNIKGQTTNKSWKQSLDTMTFIASSDLEECSVGLKTKGKSVSLAVQAKVNVQKRGSTPNCSRNSVGQKEQGELISNQIFKSQPSAERSSHKKSSTNNPPSVLRQNNQKQNCLAEREKVASKSLHSTNSQGKKVMSGDSSLGRQRSSSKNCGSSKVGSRKIGPEVTDDGKELQYSSTSVTRKKRCIDGDFNFRKDQAIVNNKKTGKATQFNGEMDSKISWTEDRKSNGMDVVSFTFTAPMGRSAPVPETAREFLEKSNTFSADFQGKKFFFNSGGTNGLRSSSVGCNVIEGDALSALLEQKLRELTFGESSCHKAGEAGSTTSSFQDQTPLKTLAKSPKLHVEGGKTGSQTDSLDEQWSPVFSSTAYEAGRISKHKLQDVEDMFDCGRKSSEVRSLLGCRHPSPISILEPSIFAESCNSSETRDSSSTKGLLSSKQCSSSVQGQDVYNMRCSKKFLVAEADAELSDSASSLSTRVVATKHVNLAVTDPVGSAKWELEYIKKISCNTETMFKDVSTGRTSEIIDPHLFDQLESKKGELNLQRKLLFDCVGECMDLRFRQYVGGGFKAWEKGLSTARRKEWLAEEVHREISSWEAMKDCMVDELVDKDMSSQCGRWLDFSVEAFEVGVEIERRILSSLLNEVISDILVL